MIKVTIDIEPCCAKVNKLTLFLFISGIMALSQKRMCLRRVFPILVPLNLNIKKNKILAFKLNVAINKLTVQAILQ